MSDLEISIFLYLFLVIKKKETPQKCTNSILSLSRKIQNILEKTPEIKAEELFKKVKAKRGYDHRGMNYGKLGKEKTDLK